MEQGDPLGPLLFCLAIHDLVQQLQSEFNVFFLDDGTLGGSLEEVLEDFSIVERMAGELSLQLNRDKSEVICDDSTTRSAMLRAVPGLSVTGRDHATLLGSPIGTASGIQDTILKRTKSLQTLGSRLQLLRAHDAFCLLCNALAIPKVLYIWRSSPCFLVPALHDFDSLLRSLLGTILNVNLSDSAWTQASLPVRAGGLGVHSTTQLAPSA